ncbi:MAG: cysteine desulfurase [Armatimonadota bacterium]
MRGAVSKLPLASVPKHGSLDVQSIRKDFPILSSLVHGKPLVYLDNAATTQKPRQVIEALVNFYEKHNANVHRAVYQLGEIATDQYEEARRKIADFIGADDPATVIFTRNATEAINLVAHSWAFRNLKEDDEILLSEAEHHSNLVPWQMAAGATGAKLRFIRITEEGDLDLEHAAGLINSRTKIVAVWHASNVLGSISPVQELARMAHEHGAVMLVDGAQSVPHMPVNVADLGCDFLAFSAHKMLGPTGIGVLWGRRELLESMEPFLGGGDMIRQVWLDRASWNEIPWKFEAGTPNIADAVAFGAAVDYLSRLGMHAVHAYEQELASYALERLSEVPDITVYGPRDPRRRSGVVSFNIAGVHPHDVGTVLDHEGVAVRAGHHCCQPLMRKLGVSATARASFYIYNTLEEVDILVEALNKVRKVFGGGSFGRSL